MHNVKRTALVTGASSGIGRAVSERLLSDGHTVIGMARHFKDGQSASDDFHPVVIDLARLADLPDRLTELGRRFPELDAGILCAGRGRFGALEQFSYPQIRELIDLDFTSHAYCARALVPIFKRKKRGNLVFLGSEAALRGQRNGTVYCAAKFALRGFAQALREECSGSGVHVSVINPGMVKTAFFDPLDFEPGPGETHAIGPEEIAGLVAFLLAQRQGTNLDEINLSPLQKVIRFKSR